VPALEEVPESVKKYNLNDKFLEQPVLKKKLTLDTASWKTFFAKNIFKINLGRPIHKSSLENELSQK
jgi:hypothetical protein